MPIRVASYNIRKAVGRDLRRDPLRVLSVIDRIGADVVALQEVDRRFGSRATSIPRELLEQHSDLRLVDLASRPQGIGWHGNAFLINKDIEIIDQFAINLLGTEPRGAVAIDVVKQGVAMRLVGVHLGLFRRDRKRQLLQISDQLRQHVALPTAILGDFNEWNRRGRNLMALHDAYAVHSPGHSFPSSRPMVGLDRIAITSDISMLGSGVHCCDDAKMASDHMPIWADISAPEMAVKTLVQP